VFFLFQNKGSEKQKKKKEDSDLPGASKLAIPHEIDRHQPKSSLSSSCFLQKKKTFPFSKVGTRTRSHVKRKKKVSLQVGEIAESVIIINSFSALLVEP
jgi:hypothetical protein